MKKVAILQSNYIPWKGYFDMIAAVDEFILYDDMQYTRRDWRNRNQIMTPQGSKWLTVPVQVKGKYHQKIKDTEIDGSDWADKHWSMLVQNYRKASNFKEIASWLEPLYKTTSPDRLLSTLNRRFIEAICEYLSIKTIISSSMDYRLIDGKTERLAGLCEQADATEYISGPAAQDYMEDELFTEKGIKLSWYDYSNYPEYPQLSGKFSHGVTILDLLFNCGEDASFYMKHLNS
jgi:hypothetical protein